MASVLRSASPAIVSAISLLPRRLLYCGGADMPPVDELGACLTFIASLLALGPNCVIFLFFAEVPLELIILFATCVEDAEVLPGC